MGTPEEKAHRARAAANRERILAAVSGGQWTTDAQLADYLGSIGLKTDGPMYNQYFSGGGYATYGSSWNPNLNYNFQTNQNIPWQGQNPEQFPWYDPSVASNWQDTDPTTAASMNSFFDWRDQNLAEGLNIDANYGGNAFAAWMQTGQGGSGAAPTLGNLVKGPTNSPPVKVPQTTNSAPPGATSLTGAPPQGATLGDMMNKSRAWNDWSRYGL